MGQCDGGRPVCEDHMSTDDYTNYPDPELPFLEPPPELEPEPEPVLPYAHRGPYSQNAGAIVCEVDHPVYGWIPWSYVAGQHDEAGELTGQQILAAIADGTIAVSAPDPEAIAEQRIAELWAEAHRLAQSIADQDARGRYLAWLIDPALPQSARDMIMQVQAAMDAVWTQYAVAKATVEAGGEPQPITAPASWPSFWDIAEASK